MPTLDKLEISIRFLASIMDQEQAFNLACTLSHVLSTLVFDTNQTVGQLSLFSENDECQIRRWNATPPEKVSNLVHNIFQDALTADPHSQAVVSNEVNMTYAELDLYASKLAYYLIGLGVGPDVIVPFCFQKSAWTVVAILATLKAGGANAALNPEYPTARMEAILSDTRAKIVLAGPGCEEALHGLDINVILINKSFIDTLQPLETALLTKTQPSDAAFVVFTSGSTGVPKGIVLNHSALCSSILAHGNLLEITPSSRVLQFASYTFDVSMFDILTTLLHGGCVCVPSEEDRVNDLEGAINRLEANTACLTTTVSTLLDPQKIPRMKHLIQLGEAASKKLTDIWATVPGVRLTNTYGPAEASILCSAIHVTPGNANPANIGTAVASRLWIVDQNDHNRLLPIGCTGELLIEGPALARGYLNLPKKTAESFIQIPSWFDDGLENRLYKTGDLVRYNSNGTIDFIARRDGQVKVNGQRVELGEIEHHVSLHHEVEHSLVVQGKSGLCNGRLIGVMSLRSHHGREEKVAAGVELIPVSQNDLARDVVGHLRQELSLRLPMYMVPTYWVVLKAMPVTSSNKTNRKLVQDWIDAMDEAAFKSISEYAAVSRNQENKNDGQLSEVEKCIQATWSRVLNLPVEYIGCNNSFLSLGGDSISAMQVMSQLRKDHILVSVKDVIRSKTVFQLAAAAKIGERPTVAAASMVETPNQLFPLTAIQNFFFATVSSERNNYSNSFLVRLKDGIRPENIKRALDMIVDRHSMLRARFQKDDFGNWTQKVLPFSEDNYEFSVNQSTSVDNLKIITTRAKDSLSIEQGPVFSASLIYMSNGGGSYLFLTAHYLVIDSVSWRVLLQEVEDTLQHGPLALEKPVPYQAWCSIHNAVAHGGTSLPTIPFALQPSNMDYWDSAVTDNTEGAMIHRSFYIDQETTALLLGKCHTPLRTEPLDVFLVAISHSFAQVFTDRQAPTIFNEGHGRDSVDVEVDLSQTIGCFSTLLPLQVAVSTGDDMLETLVKTKDQRRQLVVDGHQYLASRLYQSENEVVSLTGSSIEILFNYEGAYQQLERTDVYLQSAPPTMNVIESNGYSFAQFSINSVVRHGRLQFSFVFNKNVRHHERIDRWIDACSNTLYVLARRLARTDPIYTLSDFPQVQFDYNSLKQFSEVLLPRFGPVCKGKPIAQEVFPCAPMQQGILLSQAKSPEMYSVSNIWKIEASGSVKIDIRRLQNAWELVVQRHPALRTVFLGQLTDSSKLYNQVVLETVETDFKIIEQARNDVLAKILDQKRPVYHMLGLHHQVTVALALDGCVYVRLDFSHTIMDGGSVKIVIRDLIRAYNGVLGSNPGLSYSHFINYVYQRDLEADLKHWKRYLADAEPCYFPNLADEVSEEKKLQFVTFDLSDQLHKVAPLCARSGVTLFNIIQTAWAIVLRAYTNSDNVSFGYLASGRDSPISDIQDAVGTFINMLVCTARIDGKASVEKLIQDMSGDFSQNFVHQRCSLGEIQNAIGHSQNRLFNTGIDLQRVLDNEMGGFTIEDISSEDPTEVRYFL